MRSFLNTTGYGLMAMAMFAAAKDQGGGDDDDTGAALSIIELDENLADVEKPKEIPAGLYTAEVQDVQIQTSQKGNRYFAIKFVIPPEELAADLREQYEDGAVLYWNRQVVPSKGDARAKFNMRKLIEALGLDSNTSSIDPNEWMGQKAKLRIRHRPWEGENRAEIQAVESAERAAPKAANKSRKRG